MASVGKLSAMLVLDSKGFTAGMREAGNTTEKFAQQATTASRQTQQFTKSSNRAQRAALELSRGIEDAASQFGTMGFSGAIRGASNNLSQMGAMFGPLTGAAVGFGAALSSVLVSALDKTAKAAKGAKNALDDAFARQNKIFEKGGMGVIDERLAGRRGAAKIEDLQKAGDQKGLERLQKESAREASFQRAAVKDVADERKRFLLNTLEFLPRDKRTEAAIAANPEAVSFDAKRRAQIDFKKLGSATADSIEMALRGTLEGKQRERFDASLERFGERQDKADKDRRIAEATAFDAARAVEDVKKRRDVETKRLFGPSSIAFGMATSPFLGFGSGKTTWEQGFKDSPFEQFEREWKDMSKSATKILTPEQQLSRQRNILGLRRSIAMASRTDVVGGAGGSLSGTQDRVAIARRAAATLRKSEDPTQMELLKIAQEELVIMKQQLKALEDQKKATGGTVTIY